jgi:hypothetical protein
MWIIAISNVCLNNYCGNRVRSVSVAIVDNFDLDCVVRTPQTLGVRKNGFLLDKNKADLSGIVGGML